MADSEDNNNPLLMRKDIENLTPAELDKLIFAFYKLQAADPGVPPNLNEDSYYIIAGYHGQPFRGAGYGNPAWWGGYCHHGNVLFPTWHRAYLRRLEQALNNVSGYTDVALPYWNEFKATVPAIFTSKTYTFQTGFGAQGSFNEGDTTIDNGKIKLEHNPLFSYKLQQCFYDKLARVATNKDKTSTKNIDYSKGKGYETVRCPYSGLVGPNDLEDTERYNSTIDQNKATDELNQNVKDWLTEKSETCVPGMNELYLKAAFESPNYTAFSNTTSAAKWNDDNYGRQESWSSDFAVPLEKPHNGVHLAVGGYSMPDKDPDRPSYPGSNGDMGENDTASFDPIFFFHHCFVDYIFCLWQGVHEAEQTLEIFENILGLVPLITRVLQPS
ncbi:hypothetical protein N7513_002913 [Penicillium frequentans]|nr:hypothetical protein N7513_002913 [Penicillium glabrum]